MIFDFNEQLQAQSSLDIENIGTFGLEGLDDNNVAYYMVMETFLGYTSIVT